MLADLHSSCRSNASFLTLSPSLCAIVIEAIHRTMLSDFDPVNAIDFFGDEVVDRMVGTLRPWDARHLGETDRELAWLEKACAERNVFLLLFHADPFYDSLRRDSRLGSFCDTSISAPTNVLSLQSIR